MTKFLRVREAVLRPLCHLRVIKHLLLLIKTLIRYLHQLTKHSGYLANCRSQSKVSVLRTVLSIHRPARQSLVRRNQLLRRLIGTRYRD